MFLHLDTNTIKMSAFTSVRALSIGTGLNYNTLIYQFGKMARAEYKKPGFVIQKVKPQSCTRVK